MSSVFMLDHALQRTVEKSNKTPPTFHIVVLSSTLHKMLDIIFGNFSCLGTRVPDQSRDLYYYPLVIIISLSWQQFHSLELGESSTHPGHLLYPGQRKLLVTVLLVGGGEE